jgi:hypothetical protein
MTHSAGVEVGSLPIRRGAAIPVATSAVAARLAARSFHLASDVGSAEVVVDLAAAGGIMGIPARHFAE